ncbi:MAG: VCBS repeat-containing protein, partial [Myxococcaceae bacterium]
MSPALALLGALLAAASPPPAALEGLADQLRAQAVAARPEPPVAVAVQSSSPALAEALGAVLAARLAESGLPALVLVPGDDAPARARAAGARSLLGVRVQLGETLTAAGELRSVWRNFWAGRTPLEPGPVRVLAASATPDRA